MSHALAAQPASSIPRRWRADAGDGKIDGAVNDEDDSVDVALMRAALRLNLERGAAAARYAHAEAERAYFAGGGAPYRWWLSLTRVLDRMLAADFATGLAGEAQPRG